MTNVNDEMTELEVFGEADPVEIVDAPILPILETRPIEEVLPSNPTLITNPVQGENWNFAPPVAEIQLSIQKSLAERGLYKGKLNGKWGNLSVFAIQEYFGRVKTEPDLEVCALIQEYALEYGQESETLNVLNASIWDTFAAGLEYSNTH